LLVTIASAFPLIATSKTISSFASGDNGRFGQNNEQQDEDGYLLELFGLAPEQQLEVFRKSLTATYVPLDPLLPREGPHVAKWRLQVNISPEELQAARST
jgi:predicted transcriptional regulator of viral defense system